MTTPTKRTGPMAPNKASRRIVRTSFIGIPLLQVRKARPRRGSPIPRLRRVLPHEWGRVLRTSSESFPFGFEQLVFGQAPREAQKPGVGDHPVRRPHAPSPDRPAALEQLEGFEHPEPAHLAEPV